MDLVDALRQPSHLCRHAATDLVIQVSQLVNRRWEDADLIHRSCQTEALRDRVEILASLTSPDRPMLFLEPVQ